MSDLQLFSSEPVNFLQFLLNFGIGAILAWILRWHFIKFGSAFSNREEFSRIFPYLVLTTLVLITVVKSSLALSLGLVGALSIVRFRTPIKEPEELAYLFVAIGTGVGLGANHTLFTVVGVLLIMLVTIATKRFGKHRNARNFYVSVELSAAADSKDRIAAVSQSLASHCRYCDLHRVSVTQSDVHLTFFADFDNPVSITDATDAILTLEPEARINLVDQRRIPGV